MTEPTERLARKVRDVFDGDAGEAALDRLRSITDPMGHAVSERVQAAVVKASAGNWRRFASNASLAEVDWRDVLVAADLADEDWPVRLDEYLGHP